MYIYINMQAVDKIRYMYVYGYDECVVISA
jgi:hypothetical protein